MRHDEPKRPDPVAISVATLNVGNGRAPDALLIARLRAMPLDILALEELDRAQGDLLRRELSDLWPHQVTNGDGNEGRGVLSRYPITRSDVIELAAGRPDLLVRVDIDGVALTVLSAHPRPPKLRGHALQLSLSSIRQVLRLADLAMASAPAVLLGDFNMRPTHQLHARLERRGLIDAFAATGEGPRRTYPVRLGNHRWRLGGRRLLFRVPPVLWLDYIWHTPDIRSLATWVGRDVGSDHLPVMSRLLVPRLAVPRPSAASEPLPDA